MNLFLKLIATVFICLYGGHLIWVFGLLRGRFSIVGLRCLADGYIELQIGNHLRLAKLYRDSTITPLISILRFHLVDTAKIKLSCIILPDSLQKGLYRRLLLSFKMGGLQLIS